jgi:hypothetical protein
MNFLDREENCIRILQASLPGLLSFVKPLGESGELLFSYTADSDLPFMDNLAGYITISILICLCNCLPPAEDGEDVNTKVLALIASELMHSVSENEDNWNFIHLIGDYCRYSELINAILQYARSGEMSLIEQFYPITNIPYVRLMHVGNPQVGAMLIAAVPHLANDCVISYKSDLPEITALLLSLATDSTVAMTGNTDSTYVEDSVSTSLECG